jgi:hypothetical protein
MSLLFSILYLFDNYIILSFNIHSDFIVKESYWLMILQVYVRMYVAIKQMTRTLAKYCTCYPFHITEKVVIFVDEDYEFSR